MSEHELAAVENALASVASARKFVQFYPANNSSVQNSLDQLVSALNALIDPNGGDGEEGEAGPAVAPEGLVLIVERDNFTFEGEEVGVMNAAVKKLACDIYRMGVKRVHFLPHVSAKELRSFFEVMSLKSEKIESLGGLPKALELHDITEISLSLSEHLSLVDRDRLPDELDLVSYLRNRQVGREAPSGVDPNRRIPGHSLSPIDSEDDPREDATEDASDISDFFLDIAKGSQEKRRYLFNTLSNPTRLAEALTLISQADNSRYEEDDDLPSMGILRQSLHAIAAAIETYPDETRDAFVRNVGEAILSTDARSRKLGIAGPLADDLGKGNAEDAILGTLPDDDIVDAIALHVRFHNGTANTISNFLEEFSADPERKQTIRRMLSRLADETDVYRLREVVELLESQSPTPSSEGAEVVDRVPAIDFKDRDLLIRKLFMDEQELESVEKAVISNYRTATSEHAARTLFEFFTCLSLDTFSDQTVENLSVQLTKVLEAGSYDFLAELLPIIVNELPRDVQARIRGGISRTLSECSYPKHVDNIIASCRALDKRSPEYQSLIHLLSLLDDLAAEHIFLRIEMEKSRSTRLFLVSLCVELGERMLPTLHKKLANREWFVVRNSLHVLGKIGSQSSVDLIAELVDHNDTRVQREALRALAAVRGPTAEQAIILALDYGESVTRRFAAECLGRMGSERALSIFVDLLALDPRKLRKDTEFAIGIVKAMGQLGNVEHIPLVRKVAPRMVLFGTREKRDLAQACTDTLSRLEDESIESPPRKRRDRGE